MKQVTERWEKVRANLEKLTSLAALLSRFTLAQVFIESGWGKLQNIPKVTEYFTQLGIPEPALNARMAAMTEFGCGCLLLVGLLTRLASIPLIIVMIVAILTARKDDLHGFSDLTGFIEYLYITLLVWLVVRGAGLLSADAWIARRLERTLENRPAPGQV